VVRGACTSSRTTHHARSLRGTAAGKSTSPASFELCQNFGGEGFQVECPSPFPGLGNFFLPELWGDVRADARSISDSNREERELREVSQQA